MRSKIVKWGLAIGFGSMSAAAGAGAAIWWKAKPVHYEDCLLAEMRGQDVSLRAIAHVKCARDSRKEVAIKASDRGPATWFYRDEHMIIGFNESGELLPTRGAFQFSSKPCAEAGDDDFFVERRQSADKYGDFRWFWYRLPEEEAKGFTEPKCMKVTELHGVYAPRPNRFDDPEWQKALKEIDKEMARSKK